MTFHFENLGVIRKATFELGDLTAICGKNNTGKTFLLYALYGLLDNNELFSNARKEILSFIQESQLVQILKNELQKHSQTRLNLQEHQSFFQQLFQNYFQKKAQQLHFYFSTRQNFFQTTKIFFETTSLKERSHPYQFSHENFAYEIRKDLHNNFWVVIKKDSASTENLENTLASLLYQFLRYLFQFPVPYFLSAQRESIYLFSGAISSFARANLLKFTAGENNIQTIAYPLPIEANIQYVSEILPRAIHQDSLLLAGQKKLTKEIEELLGIRYKWVNNQLFVEAGENELLPAHLASTSVRGLADLHFYLKHIADYGHLLIIDEPELSLHPENQIKLARLFVKLVNAGLKICIATHSDYIIKELNNCLMLSNDFPNKEKIMKKLGYMKNDILQPHQFKYYTAYRDESLGGCTLKLSAIDKLGITAESFNYVIEEIAYNSDKIINAVED
ncbi:MAG: AAA family ATPase [Raineya sp.]|nr:ATP-binding protein [Raineya sp.]MDW8297112.1 AAA family ATPase [Raineya sp.]